MDAVDSPATPHQDGRDMMKTVRPVRVRPEVESGHRAQVDASRTADDGLHHEEPRPPVRSSIVIERVSPRDDRLGRHGETQEERSEKPD